MKYLTVIRHAKTKNQQPGQRDFERALKKEGFKAARKLGEMLKKQGRMPDTVITSPARRAVETTETVCAAAGIDYTIVSEEPLIYDNDLTGILGMISGIPDDSAHAYIVGHNPSFSELVVELCGPVIEGMKTGSAAGIEIDVVSWKDIASGKGSLGFYITT